MRFDKKLIFTTGFFLAGLTALLISLYLERHFMTNIDERDHLVAGYLMNSGRVIYRDFFTNHFPFPYYWVDLFSGLWAKPPFFRAISVFRLTLAPLYLICPVCIFILSKSYQTKVALSLWLLITAVILPDFHGNLVLSETISGIFLTGIFWIMAPYFIGWEKISTNKLLFLTLLSLSAFWTQPLYLPLLLLPYWLAGKSQRPKIIVLTILGLGVPITLFILNRQLNQFIFQALIFNFTVYTKMFPEQIASHNYWYQTILQLLKNELFLLTHWNNPISIFQGVTHLALIYLTIRIIVTGNKKYIISFLILMLVLRIREVKVIPGQIFNFGIYPLMLITSASSAILAVKLESDKKLVAVGMLLVVFFSSVKVTLPIIKQALNPGYNYHVFWSWRQETGEVINQLTLPQEPILIYPSDVDLYFFAQRLPIDKFTYWFPWINSITDYRDERLRRLRNNPPPVIYLGNMEYHRDKNYYLDLFPNIIDNYYEVLNHDKPSAIWIRDNLLQRAVENGYQYLEVEK